MITLQNNAQGNTSLLYEASLNEIIKLLPANTYDSEVTFNILLVPEYILSLLHRRLVPVEKPVALNLESERLSSIKDELT